MEQFLVGSNVLLGKCYKKHAHTRFRPALAGSLTLPVGNGFGQLPGLQEVLMSWCGFVYTLV